MTTTTHNAAAASHFNAATRRSLAKKGIALVSLTFVPGEGGSFLNGETAYLLDDNGIGRVRTFLGVLDAAK